MYLGVHRRRPGLELQPCSPHRQPHHLGAHPACASLKRQPRLSLLRFSPPKRYWNVKPGGLTPTWWQAKRSDVPAERVTQIRKARRRGGLACNPPPQNGRPPGPWSPGLAARAAWPPPPPPHERGPQPVSLPAARRPRARDLASRGFSASPWRAAAAGGAQPGGGARPPARRRERAVRRPGSAPARARSDRSVSEHLVRTGAGPGAGRARRRGARLPSGSFHGRRGAGRQLL
ncbi:translation initiation factor IF-2-like [Herpailurus yagouaroundi]|uniref:translation initiation factor IF-2-like n=1 Tax=Herpailurus yagouaroundi TaxID=1608482 RepID=UPI001AD6C4FD|nr:translation initiation factor IF-2-like [Puma yagouaroundi]XP_040327912.1 translation initiation factor IF-2-like [Puma yagouaroundi]XP_040327913.1 translation initiation factor IF-2-like [Puma yagouaroundi]